MKIVAPWITAATPVCQMLTDAGYQAWFVGGCVRNALLDEPVADIDVCTTADPETVSKLAESAGFHAIPTGVEHGTITVVINGEPYEITTLRKDVETDGRRAVVSFADTILEDAKRRDFTMNAIYAEPDGTIKDPLNGLRDLQARRLRFIEDPDQRIREDYLRILRFFRFHAWYGQNGIDAEGLAACAKNADGLYQLSKERIGSEFLKLLSAPNPAPALASFASTGGLLRILPGASHDSLAVLIHIEEENGLRPDAIRRLACIGGEDAQNNLRLSKDQSKRLAILRDSATLNETANTYGANLAIDQAAVLAASMGQPLASDINARAIYAAKQTFPITSADLMPRYAGAALGKKLKEAKTKWIASDFTLTKDDLLA